ncbi:MAG: thioesterase family protein [Pseudomonadota bacterium]
MRDDSGLTVHRGQVLAEWIDANGHMNVAWYGLVFDQAVDALWERIGHDPDYRQQHRSTTFAAESHSRYLKEIGDGETFVVQTRIVDMDERRVHQFQQLYADSDSRLVATCEWMHLHVSLATRRVSAWPADIYDQLAMLAREQRDWPAPDGLAASIGMRRSST